MKKFAALTLVLLFTLWNSAVFAQDATEVGAAPSGLHSLEMIGRIDQELFVATAYGYVTHINGLTPDLLFSPDAPALMRDAPQARFTFYGTGASTARSVYEGIFASSVDLEVTFYYSETPIGASFDNPESFMAGTPIATQTIRMQTILNVQEPNVGVLMGHGEATQAGTQAFSLGGASYTLGHDGVAQRFDLFGQGFRASAEPLAAHYLFAGSSTVIGE